MSENPYHRTQERRRLVVLRVGGGGLLLATGAIHLDLYLTGYRSIPTIGWLFLLQIITAFGLAAAILATGSRVLAAAGAGFALSTLGGYLLTLWIGLFGFREVRTTAGVVAGVIEIAAFAASALLAIMPRAPIASGGRSHHDGASVAARSRRGELSQRLQSGLPGIGRAVAATAVVAAAVLAVSLATSGAPAAVSPATSTVLLEVATVGGKAVVTNSHGFTLYWFAPDTPTTSRCNGTCAAYWPPVTGRPLAGRGVLGTLGTLVRTDGAVQATYDGHPLYTYVGDGSPRQANGNGIDLNGGLWHEVAAAG